MNFSRLQTANFEGLLAASQEISRQQAAEIQPLYYSQLKMEQDVGWIFRSGNAERREAMQRIVDRSDAKPGRKRRPQMLHFYLRRVLMRHEHYAVFPLILKIKRDKLWDAFFVLASGVCPFGDNLGRQGISAQSGYRS